MKDEIEKISPFNVANHFVIEDDCLFHVESNSKYISRRVLRVVIPKNLIKKVFIISHCLPIKGHMGFNRTWMEIVKNYYYPNLYIEILNLFNNCDVCKLNQITKQQSAEYQFIEPNEPFEILEIDHITINVLSKNGFKYILVVTDKFSRKSWFLPCKTLTATETFNLLFNHVFSQFFFPKFIFTDNGTEFNNELD